MIYNPRRVMNVDENLLKSLFLRVSDYNGAKTGHQHGDP